MNIAGGFFLTQHTLGDETVARLLNQLNKTIAPPIAV